MSNEVYLLLTGLDQCPDIIYSRNTELRIKVFCLIDTPYTQEVNEIQLYGYINGSLMVFETVNIQADDALDMIAAIRWYANYMGFPEMEILPDDPRIDREIAV
ncbi:hypothetical protein BDD43_5566 [Mucilaginibacter gracilis]|uniref:Uncharacterized protein n=1 Tax=Mucilaginibacter gracilis TaxID=423350 RepID=A0A495JAB8_9SPHI|nr:hypothetical protein [Mucilaginibacter gracilis]RKR85302.1 hypothetical protein BDD43_5566 [Mucilaginibacter gracilis]